MGSESKKNGRSNGAASGSDLGSNQTDGLDREKLESAIRDHVIGRMTRARAEPAQTHHFANTDPQLAELLNAFSPTYLLEAVLDPNPMRYNRILDTLIEGESRLKHVCTHFISPVAEELGRMWTNDQVSFTQVSLASGRMSVMIQQLSAENRARSPLGRKRSILLGRMPGADHTLGLAVVSACFREAGWDVDGGADFCFDDRTLERIAERRYTVFGITVGHAGEIDQVDSCIRTVSCKLANKRPLFGLGGPAAKVNRAQLSALNADFIATDAWEALSMAEDCAE